MVKNNPPTWEVSFREEDHKALYIEKFGEKMLYWWCPTCKAEEENCEDPKCDMNHCPDWLDRYCISFMKSSSESISTPSSSAFILLEPASDPATT